MPEEPENEPKPTPKPITSINDTEDFDGKAPNYSFSTAKPDVSKGEAIIVAPENYEGKNMLKMVKAATGVNDYWTILSQKNAVTAEAMVFSFKYSLDEAQSTGSLQQIYFSTSDKTPYFLTVKATSDGYTFCDINSNNGSTVTNTLTGKLSFQGLVDLGGNRDLEILLDAASLARAAQALGVLTKVSAAPRLLAGHIE